MAKANTVAETVDTTIETTDGNVTTEEVKHSPKFDDIKMYYDTHRWSLAMVKNAVKKGKITEEEYTEITGREYKA